jgi:hypothetical protein
MTENQTARLFARCKRGEIFILIENPVLSHHRGAGGELLFYMLRVVLVSSLAAAA